MTIQICRHLKACILSNCKGTEPLLDIQFNGDGLLIDKCHVAGVETGNYNFLNLYFCNGGKISRCINGDIRIGKSTGMSLENWHCEHGKLIIESSQVSVKNVHQWYHQTSYGLSRLRLQNPLQTNHHFRVQ